MSQVRTNQAGFTIVELLIATSILSVILLMVTLVTQGIGILYAKGISQSQIQNDVRSIADDISQQVKVYNHDKQTAGPAVDGTTALCIGTVRYTYVIGKQIGTDSTHVLWRDTIDPSSGCTATAGFLSSATPSSGGTELIAPHSRLEALNLVGSTSPYGVQVAVVYGDIDLLCDGGVSNDCKSTTNTTHLTSPSSYNAIRCKDVSSGRQFCAAAYLSTTVVKRLQG